MRVYLSPESTNLQKPFKVCHLHRPGRLDSPAPVGLWGGGGGPGVLELSVQESLLGI